MGGPTRRLGVPEMQEKRTEMVGTGMGALMKIKTNLMRYLFLVVAGLGLSCPFYGQTPVYQPVLSYWVLMGLNTASNFAFVQNVEDYTAYDIPTAVIANQVCVRPNTADNTATNNYSFALYNSSGAKILDTGAVHGTVIAPATVPTCVALSSAGTILPGRYYVSFTTNCSTSCAALATYGLAQLTPLANRQGAATSGGAANSTITPPADTFASVASSPWFELRK